MNNPQAKLSTRTFAFSIDMFAIACLQLILGSACLFAYRSGCAHFGVSPSEEAESVLSEFCGGFLFISYFTFTVALFGNTLGKYMFRIQIIDELTEKPVTIKKAYWRAMSYLMSSWTYMIGFMIPLFRKDKKALHDLLCGTRVVQRAPTAASNEPQLELPFFAPVLPIRTPTKPEAPALGRTGTDP